MGIAYVNLCFNGICLHSCFNMGSCLPWLLLSQYVSRVYSNDLFHSWCYPRLLLLSWFLSRIYDLCFLFHDLFMHDYSCFAFIYVKINYSSVNAFDIIIKSFVDKTIGDLLNDKILFYLISDFESILWFVDRTLKYDHIAN